MTILQYCAYAALSILLCICSYKAGENAGRTDALINVIEWVIDIMRMVWNDEGPDDPAPEEAER